MEQGIIIPNNFPERFTKRLHLQNFKLDDAKELFEIRSDKEFVKYLGTYPMKTLEEAENMIQGNIDSFNNKEGLSWKICEKGSERLIGYIGFWRINQNHFRGEIGFGIHPNYQNKGYMKEACRAVLDYGFSFLNIHSVLADTDSLNIASQKLLVSQGFKKEGVLRESFYFDGEFIDSVYFGLLESDFNGHAELVSASD